MRYHRNQNLTNAMGRNLYILAATLLLFAMVSCALQWTTVQAKVDLPGDASLWHSIALVLLILALIAAVLGTLAHMFSQADRRYSERRRNK